MVAETRRLVYFFVAWAFLISVLIQVFLAGLFIFDRNDFWRDVHELFGYTGVHFVGLALIIIAAISKLPRRDLIVAIVAPALSFFMVIFAQPAARAQSIFLSALHPLSAVIIFGLAVLLVVWARDLVPPPWGRATPAPTAPAQHEG